MNINTLLDKAPRFIIYGLVLLMPVFFLPFTTLPVDLNKQVLLAVGVLFATLFWLIDILRKGTIQFKAHILLLPLFAFIIVAGISSYGSGAFLHSFWGMYAETDSFFNLLLFSLLFLVSANKLQESSQVKNAIYFFIAGAVLGSIFTFAHSFYPSIFPWDFARQANFNPFGSVYAFGVYAGGAFMMALALLSYRSDGPHKTYKTYLLSAAALILFLTVFVINIWVSWVGVALGVLLLVYFLSKRKLKDGVPAALVLPLFIFAIALTFLFIKEISFVGVGAFPPEVRLGREMTMQIAQDSTKSSTKNALVGSGPATFKNQFALYKSPGLNTTSFWSASFDRGTGAITSFFVTGGILGGGFLLFFWALFLIFGAKHLRGLGNAKKSIVVSEELLAVYLGGLYLLISWILYDAYFSILFAGFFVVASWLALHGKTKEIRFIKTPQGTFWGMAGGTILLVLVLLGFYTVYKNYSAELFYASGVKYADEKDYANAIPLLQKSAEINSLDKRWRKLSQVLFLQSSKVFKNQGISAEERKEAMQRGLLAAESAARKSISANPNNSINFEQFGNFYRNIISLSGDGFGLAISNYDKAAKLTPQSPHIPLYKARAYLANSQRIKSELDALSKQLALAEQGTGRYPAEQGTGRYPAEQDKAEESEITEQGMRQRIAVLRAEYRKMLEAIVLETKAALKIKGDFVPAQELLSQVQEALK